MKTLNITETWSILFRRAYRQFRNLTELVEENLYPSIGGPNFYFPNAKTEGGEQLIFSESTNGKSGQLSPRLGIDFEMSTRDGWHDNGKFFSVILVEVIPIDQYGKEKHGFTRFKRHIVTVTYVYHKELGLMRSIRIHIQNKENEFDEITNLDSELHALSWFVDMFTYHVEIGTLWESSYRPSLD